MFADGAEECSRANFDERLCAAEYQEPLGVPKWSVPGKVLVDNTACKTAPSKEALDTLWAALGGTASSTLSSAEVISKFKEWAVKDELREAVLCNEFIAALGDVDLK